ncbi:MULTISPECIES: precorrin-3B synthase [Sinorhizobium]|uniref:Precorrin-3B synthase n=2 Tax=Sinorhizobium TaxID=28105 RepID=A0A2S3YSW9_9HYPH|nr:MULTISPECIES: precorrin-3B synthase [Sinorhizobium]AUX77463.1 precorrin-3B synthase [Sinorhizobium fredii]PDT36230.1 precorrin-3B synthase [Sinorhizobium sp. FG01]PDT54094.1 precorrin-3B synthase [Sinorhizobium sp. NG07B]POH31151.1 precorrin-3B synthase [Sinorhizobium americanum]POH34727.1 precorrin-3B synthase [Sinorhizobium americanum]
MTSCAAPRSQTEPGTSMRRGACPSLAAPMQTGDGLLVRLRPATGGLTPAELRALAEAAADCGSGIIEVTARGNLQVRGLIASSVPALAAAIGEAGIAVTDGVAIETPPLAGFDPREIADPRPLAAALRDAIAERRPALALAPKLSIVIDGNGRFHLRDVAADLRLEARNSEDGLRWLLSFGGAGRPERPVALLEAERVVPALMEILAELDHFGPAARGRDLDADAIRQRLSAGLDPLPAAGGTSPFLPAGIHDFGDGRTVLGVALAFAQTDSASLIAFLQSAGELGATEIRLAPRHGLLVLGLSREAAALAQQLALSHGFLVSADDPRNHVATCAGLACASALMDTKVVAGLLLEVGADLLDGSLAIHLSGCPKGCARPVASPLTLVGAPSGYALVVNGAASVAPSAYTDEGGIKAALAALNALVRENKDAGESARSCLTRLGTAHIVDAFEQG